MKIDGEWIFSKRPQSLGAGVVLDSDSVAVHPDIDLTGIQVGEAVIWDGAKLAPGAVGTDGDKTILKGESLSQSSTTSSSPVLKLRIQPTLEAGKQYAVIWSYNWSHSSNGSDFRAEVEVDSVQYMYHSQEPQDSGTDQQIPAAGEFYITGSGVVTIDLNFWRESNTAYIRDARLRVVEVAA